jgi:hypothetical protein
MTNPIITAPYVTTPPATLAANALALAETLAPGLTSLPANLIGDMNSTSTGALIIQDQAVVDLVNSVSPYTANATILYQLGNVYGVQQGVGSNTSVYVVFTGTPGYVINPGVIVSDGTYQYQLQESTVIGVSGSSASAYCLALVAGTWAVPVNSVTQIVTVVPFGVTLTVTNPTTGTPGAAAQSLDDYQAQVIQAGQAVSTGIGTLVRTTLQNVSGVQARLVSFRQVSGGWQVLVGGGDPYAVANAIYQSMFNIIDLQGALSAGSTETITVNDYPDNYVITFVVPAQQAVTMTINWTTIAGSNFVANSVVTAAVQPAIVAYVNSVVVGKTMSQLELQQAFLTATANIIDPTTLSKLTFTVQINGIEVTPSGVLFAGDPEAYFYAVTSGITVSNS